jgi:hypothetical protein
LTPVPGLNIKGGGIIYDFLKKDRIMEALAKKPLPRSIEIQELGDEISYTLVIFGHILIFLISFCCPWTVFVIGSGHKK